MSIRKACTDSVWKFRDTSAYFLPLHISIFFIKGICIDNKYIYPVVKSNNDVETGVLEYVRPTKHLFLDFFDDISTIPLDLSNPLYGIFYKDDIKYLVVDFNKEEYVILFEKEGTVNWKIINKITLDQNYQFLGYSKLTFSDFL